MVITKMFSFYFFQSVTLEIRVATPFLIGSVEILRDYRHFSKKNCFRLFFLGGGGGKIGTKITSMGGAWVSSATTGWVKKQP